MTSAAQALNRVKSADTSLYDFKKKIHKLRRIVAGDRTALYDDVLAENYDSGARQQRPFRLDLPDILVEVYGEGENNAMLSILKTLVFQTAYTFPAVKLEGVTDEEQIVNAHYLKQKLGPTIKGGCEFVDQIRIALFDFVIGGIGAVQVSADSDGIPYVRWRDTIDVRWDQQARLPSEIEWISVTNVEPLGVWLDMFPDSKWLQDKVMKHHADNRANVEDFATELEFYYDVSGKEGSYIVFGREGDNRYTEDPLYEGPNPHKMKVGEVLKPFLPFEMMFFMSIPSVRLPIGLAEMILPAQMAIWEAERHIRSTTKGGRAAYVIPEKGLDSEGKKVFEQSLENSILWWKDNTMQPSQLAPLEISPGVQEELQRNLAEINRQAGISDYSMGQKADGVETATEARYIAGQGQLTTGTVASANARLCQAALTKFLWIAKRFDKNSFSCQVNGHEYKFGPRTILGPVSRYLKPEAELTVSQDSTRFRSTDEEVAQARMDIEVSQIAAQAGFPNALQAALRKFYEAIGDEDITERLERPQMQPGQAQVMPGQPMPGQQTIPGQPQQTATMQNEKNVGG